MNAIVRYEFDNTSFVPKETSRPLFIKLSNPPVIPATGDTVHIRVEEFFDDADLISAFEEHSEGIVYYAERLNTIIGKNEIEVIIVLHEEVNFKRFFPQF